jgi:hypothetical protein
MDRIHAGCDAMRANYSTLRHQEYFLSKRIMETQIIFYKAFVVPYLLCGREIWVITKAEEMWHKIQAYNRL